jgi:predicted dehydrogenase
MTKEKKHRIRCAVVGLGRIGSTLEFDRLREKPASHAGAISAHPECRIVAGCDTDSKKRDAFSRAWRCASLYDDYANMLRECAIDILHIATPPETHHDILRAALEQAIPVIVCEKPLAATRVDGESMARMAKDAPSRIIINHERRYALNYARTKEVIDRGVYGKMVSIVAKVHMGYRAKAAEVLLDDGTHMVDLLRFLTGKNLNVHCAMGDPASKEVPLVAVMSPGGVPILLEVGPGRDHIVFEVDISFQHGRIVVGNGVYEEYESTESPFYEHMKSLKKKRIVFRKTEYFKRMFDEAVALYKGEKKVSSSTIEDGLEALRVIEEIISACGAPGV